MVKTDILELSYTHVTRFLTSFHKGKKCFNSLHMCDVYVKGSYCGPYFSSMQQKMHKQKKL